VPACDRQSDGQTDGFTVVSTARDLNGKLCWHAVKRRKQDETDTLSQVKTRGSTGTNRFRFEVSSRKKDFEYLQIIYTAKTRISGLHFCRIQYMCNIACNDRSRSSKVIAFGTNWSQCNFLLVFSLAPFRWYDELKANFSTRLIRCHAMNVPCKSSRWNLPRRNYSHGAILQWRPHKRS